jgi:anti-sigma regulatory factor (Ser/Thr protein kinase)
MITGGAALAILILVSLATMIIASSLARSLRRLERRAGEEARLRRSASVIFTGFFGRSHSLLERLLRLIDDLELGEEDPERLASLFQVDHLATRMRRNSDSALVLAGHKTPGRRTEPVTLVDVLRAAVSEIEHYDRVILNVQQRVSVSGSAAADSAHLLAELLENATKFSPRTTRVTMSEHTARGGDLLINISDGGMGVPEEQLRQLNRQLARPSLADAAVVGQMGLFAVAHLALRHGIKVTLEPRPGGGTTAVVRLPLALISKGAKPGGWPGHAGEFLRAGARGGVAAADPRRAAPRFTAGPQFAAGPQIASPDAGALTLGAPLPSWAPSASFAGTVPESAGAWPAGAGLAGTEPAGTEPGAALPIFESLESDYFHAHSHGLLRPGEPQASQPTLTGQPDAASASPAPATTGRPAATADSPAFGDRPSARLPQRIPQAALVRSAAADPGTRPATTTESAQIALGLLASFQRGSRRARGAVPMERDPQQPARDR